MDRADIQNNILSFSQDSLRESSLNLFKTLGYTTERQYRVSSIEDFKGRFLLNNLNEDKALYSHWKDAQFLFELQPDDLNSEETEITGGRVGDKDIETYWFYAIELKGDTYSKKQLSDITREVNKVRTIPAFILFKYADKLTFSIIDRRLNKKDENKDVLEKVVLIKDINYTNPHRAHIDILEDIAFKNLKVENFVDLHLNWLKALSVSELNKRFYTDLSNWFFWTLDNCKLSKENKHEDNVMFAIRMVTRIIFDWFIKEKGLVSEKLFDKQTYLDLLKPEYKEQGNLYYKVILQNLFFGCLSVPMNERRFRKKDSFQGKNPDYNMNIYYRYEDYFQDSNEFLELVKNIPFINGGLFECLDDKDNKITIDCFTDCDAKNFLQIPDDIFFMEEEKTVDISSHFDGNKNYKNAKIRGLFPILNSYKFTIDETTPVEEEIALDPELLGRVFENLLAAHNPETETTARKSTGSYYTPREIVDYMCEQSLTDYLKTKVESLNIKNIDDKLEQLMSYSEIQPFKKEEEVDELIKAVNEVKILDPACGSGAFPMGLLHKLVHVLSKLDPNNEKWKKTQINTASEISDIKAREIAINAIEKEFKDNDMNYSRKLYLIQNCIYGVDIQPMATQISRLRFFISLIVDEKIDIEKENWGIYALPNLETKFVTANTLVCVEPEHSLLASMLDDLKFQLKKCRKEYFNAKGRNQKKKLRDQDQILREQIINKAKELHLDVEKTAKLVSWNPYAKDKKSEWFDSEWMFDVDKFDIVIGNPPYLESRNKSFTDEMKNSNLAATKSRWGEYSIYFSRGCDLLIYFYELSLYLLKENGINAFITQNAWLDTEYGKNFQTFLSKKTEILGIIDSDYKYFDSSDGPNINTIITFFKNTNNKSNKLIFSRCKVNFNSISFPLTKMNQFDSNIATYKEYSLSDSKIQKLKWGLLLYTDENILEVINKIFEKGLFIESFKNVKFGQGLNISKSLIVDNTMINNYNIPEVAKIPFLSKESTFNILQVNSYLINENVLDSAMKNNLKNNDVLTYNPKCTTKRPPILTMPRGIGGKHFCAFNTLNAYTDSYVDIYDNSNMLSQENKINLWCYFNSSLCWLIREISGRKNLGGGMLKAEAVDLSYFPCYFEFNQKDNILKIFENISKRTVLNALEEINTPEHKEIDKIIFDYLDFDEQQRKIIIDKFKEYYIARCKKSQT